MDIITHTYCNASGLRAPRRGRKEHAGVPITWRLTGNIYYRPDPQGLTVMGSFVHKVVLGHTEGAMVGTMYIAKRR
jgi:hypothetical protein